MPIESFHLLERKQWILPLVMALHRRVGESSFWK